MNPTNQPLPQHQSMEQQEHQARIAKNHKAWSCQGNQGVFLIVAWKTRSSTTIKNNKQTNNKNNKDIEIISLNPMFKQVSKKKHPINNKKTNKRSLLFRQFFPTFSKKKNPTIFLPSHPRLITLGSGGNLRFPPLSGCGDLALQVTFFEAAHRSRWGNLRKEIPRKVGKKTAIVFLEGGKI